MTHDERIEILNTLIALWEEAEWEARQDEMDDEIQDYYDGYDDYAEEFEDDDRDLDVEGYEETKRARLAIEQEY